MTTHHHDAILTVSAKVEKSLLRRHPWIFSGAVQKENRDHPAGGTVAVQSADGRWLAWGAYSPHSQIRVRVWSFDPTVTVDSRFFRHRIANAVKARQCLPLPRPCTALRLINAESDGLPGVVVDRYADFLVCQFLSAGAQYWKACIVEALRRQLPIRGIYERSDVDVRRKEGLPLESGVLWGETPPGLLEVQCGPLRQLVDMMKGHKTGLYLDQRENQARIADFAGDAQVLNCFSYTGGFGLWALHAGARQVTQIDASADMLAIARQNAVLNGMPEDRIDYINANVFEKLRTFRDNGRQFDRIILDPPKFVASAGQMKRGCRGYKDINLLAFKLLRPSGVLMTFSCSGLVSPPLFQKIVADAALDAGRNARIIGQLSQAPDHPVGMNFPEGHYLKGLIIGCE